ncbi:phage minor structural protein Gp20 [Leptotrichia wadei]|uniref:Phage minor structural protein Gp20 n=1 Tax=Leptotrichia wadei TaxID=157687 RepID=A0A510KER8_9FUSO|nr:phage scaffolding protein [Leptotrichia wadei]BBM48393.1 phage minor structural protein Gp20 [Leptotrichia wadei]
MNKEDLLKLGLSEEQAEKVLSANAEQLKGFIPKSRFDEVNNTKKQLEKDLKDRDVQLENLKNSSGDVETMKQTIENLQRDNKVAKDNFEAELAKFKLESAIDTTLLGSNVINTRAVKALLDMDKIKLDGDVLIGINEQIEALKNAEDSKMLFKVTETKQKEPNFSGVKPGEGNTQNSTGESAGKIKTYSEMMAEQN